MEWQLFFQIILIIIMLWIAISALIGTYYQQKTVASCVVHNWDEEDSRLGESEKSR